MDTPIIPAADGPSELMAPRSAVAGPVYGSQAAERAMNPWFLTPHLHHIDHGAVPNSAEVAASCGGDERVDTPKHLFGS